MIYFQIKVTHFLAIMDLDDTGDKSIAHFNYLLNLTELSSATIAPAIAFSE